MGKILIKNKLISNMKISDKLILKVNKNIFVEYPNYGLNNYYNEIHNFINDNSQMPKDIYYAI